MDTDTMKIIPDIRHMMKRCFILKTDWLQYSQGISQSAYEEESDNDCCVYRQLENVLLNPKTGIAKKRINGAKVSQQSLFYYFVNIIREYRLNAKYPNFTIESSVSAELISYLCKDIERNMYCYSANSKCFISITEFSSKNYSPKIVRIHIVGDILRAVSSSLCNVDVFEVSFSKADFFHYLYQSNIIYHYLMFVETGSFLGHETAQTQTNTYYLGIEITQL